MGPMIRRIDLRDGAAGVDPDYRTLWPRIDLTAGLAGVREPWIAARGYTATARAPGSPPLTPQG